MCLSFVDMWLCLFVFDVIPGQILPCYCFPSAKGEREREREREREKRHQLQPVNFNPLLKRMLKIHVYSEQKDSSAKAFTAHQLHKSNIRKNPVGQP
jgi:hypothetical protein